MVAYPLMLLYRTRKTLLARMGATPKSIASEEKCYGCQTVTSALKNTTRYIYLNMKQIFGDALNGPSYIN